MIEAILRSFLLHRKSTTKQNARRLRHVHKSPLDFQKYYKNGDRYIPLLEKYLGNFIGADEQTTFSLSPGAAITEKWGGKAFKGLLIDIVEQDDCDLLHRLTLTRPHEIRADHNIKTAFRALTEAATVASLAGSVNVSLTYSPSENKNQFLKMYICFFCDGFPFQKGKTYDAFYFPHSLGRGSIM